MVSLVTGCAGFIGSHLTESLLEDGGTVLGVDCFNDNYGRAQKIANLQTSLSWDNFEFVPVDLARGDLNEFVNECEVVYHLAAEPGVRASWGKRFELYLRNNLLATQHVLEAVKDSAGTRLVYASSSSVYGEAESFPTSEETVPLPYSPYGVTKLAAENLCHLYHGNHGLPVVSLRYFSVFGPRQRPDMAFHNFCARAVRGEPLPVYGDGEQSRDFTYVDDVVAATRAAAITPAAVGRVYNIGGGSQTTLNEAIELLTEFVGRKLDVNYFPRESGDVRDTGANVERARRELKFDAQTTLAEGLRAELDWVLSRDVVGEPIRG